MKHRVALLAVLMMSGSAVAYGYYRPESLEGLRPLTDSAISSLSEWFSGSDAPRVIYRTAEMDRGSIVPAVMATGTVEAVTTVTVGTQVSGQVVQINTDYNAEVKKGDVIAVFDRTTFQNEVSQIEAELEHAQASVAVHAADLEHANAQLAKAHSELAASVAQTQQASVEVGERRRDLDRKRILVAGGNRSAVDQEQAQAAYERSLAGWRGAEAQEKAQSATVLAVQAQIKSADSRLATARASVKQKIAMLRTAQTMLERTLIRSPIDGIVIDREVEVGQTIAASLQSPTLFTIAHDLREMQIKVLVDEADVGRIRERQKVLFTVDAFPGQTFTGEVMQIRQNPVAIQYVVTYTVIVSAPNPERLLMPGMTANARVVLAERSNVQRVPSAALRFRPPGSTISGPHVWVEDNGVPRPIPVDPGVMDGTYVEIKNELPEGLPVIVAQDTIKSTSPTKKIFGAGF